MKLTGLMLMVGLLALGTPDPPQALLDQYDNLTSNEQALVETYLDDYHDELGEISLDRYDCTDANDQATVAALAGILPGTVGLGAAGFHIYCGQYAGEWTDRCQGEWCPEACEGDQDYFGCMIDCRSDCYQGTATEYDGCLHDILFHSMGD